MVQVVYFAFVLYLPTCNTPVMSYYKTLLTRALGLELGLLVAMNQMTGMDYPSSVQFLLHK